VQGTVELVIAEAEPVSAGAVRRTQDWRGAGQHGEGCFAADPPGVGEGHQDLGGAEDAGAGLGCNQPRSHVNEMQ
jgi:hypothetical protein